MRSFIITVLVARRSRNVYKQYNITWLHVLYLHVVVFQLASHSFFGDVALSVDPAEHYIVKVIVYVTVN